MIHRLGILFQVSMHLGLEGLLWSQTFPSAQKLCSKGRLLGCLLFCPQEIRVKTKAWKGSWFFLKNNFLSFPLLKKPVSQTTALLTFFLLQGGPVYNGTFSTKPGLYPSNTRNFWSPPQKRDNWKCLQMVPKVSWEWNCPQLRIAAPN